MKEIKKLFLRIFFALEIMIFMLFYFFGTQGLQALMRLKKENEQLDQQIDVLHQEVQGLKQEVIHWQEDPFYKEKVAREQLQMACKNDQIYRITKKE